MSLVNSLIGIVLAIFGATATAYFVQVITEKNRKNLKDTSVKAVLEGNRINFNISGHPSSKEIEQAILLAIGKHNRNTENLQEVFVINEENEEEWIEFGNALRKIGRHEEAIASLNKALEINPQHYGAWFQRGVTLGEIKCFDEALESYERAVLFNPKHIDAWVNKGIILSNQYREREALHAFSEVLKIDPKNHIARSFSQIR